eukprot:COSAG04_NODE_133_length_23964_cov_7.547999_6_plen_47_part_00
MNEVRHDSLSFSFSFSFSLWLWLWLCSVSCLLRDDGSTHGSMAHRA